MKTWKFWMQPRNSKSAPVEEILVQGKDINEATSKAVSKRPGHIWLQHEEILTEDLTPEELNAEIEEDLDMERDELDMEREAYRELNARDVIAATAKACGVEMPEMPVLQLRKENGAVKNQGEILAEAQEILQIRDEQPKPWTEKETKGRPWTPTRREGEEVTLAQIVTEAIGTGSMCWKETPKGIFDEQAARWAADGAVAAIQELIEQQVSERFPHQIGNTTVIGRECFIDKDASVISYRGENFVKQETWPDGSPKVDEPSKLDHFGQNETLPILQAKAEKFIAEAQGATLRNSTVDCLHEFMTRAFNAGYQTAQQDIATREARTAKPEGMAYAQADLDADEGPQAPSRHDQEIEDLRMEITRRDDILRLIEQTTEQQAPFGSDLANFRRRILLLVRA